MTTPSPKLQLALPTQTDPFSTADVRENWEKIDAAPGTYICTSTTRPALTAAQAGRKIYETNTGLEWVWNGTAWRRLGPFGLLKRSNGNWAIAERTTDFTTTSNTFVKVVTVADVVVPAGNRPLKIEVAWYKAKNVAGNFHGAIFRSDTNNSGPTEVQWVLGTSTNDANAGGGTFFALIRDGLAAGTYTWSFQINGPAGTSSIEATATTPTTLLVTEL